MADSATFNEPPATQEDYWVVKAYLLKTGLTSVDPHDGVHISPERPEPYHYSTKGPGIIAGNAICIVVMLAATMTRLCLRWLSPRLKWGVDDALMIPALLLAVVYPAMQIAMVNYGGAGQHIYDVTYHEYYVYGWLAAVAQIDFFVCVGLVKMSIAVFNMRITGIVVGRAWKIANWTFFSIVLAYTLLAFFINVFQCVPAITSFDDIAIGKRGVPPSCIGVSEMNTILRAINITLDFCLLTVPILVVSRLQMSLKKKLRVSGLFAFGAIACIGSVLTLVAKFNLATDPLWNYTDLLAWTLVEIVFGVITASLPTLAIFLPGGLRSGTTYTVWQVTGPSATQYSQYQYPPSERLNSWAQYKSYDDEGIMRQDHFELESAATSVRSIEGGEVRIAQAMPHQRQSAILISSGHSNRSEPNQPGQYGPLERGNGTNCNG